MKDKQKIFYLTILIIYIVLMILCFMEKDYITIIKSICILIGSFILSMVFAKLGDDK